MEANEMTQIEPGDAIKVELPLPGGVQLEEAREARETRQSGPSFAGSWTDKR